MATQNPCWQSSVAWVRDRLNDRSAFAPMTGQDSSAFAAFVHLVELYGRADQVGRLVALEAMRQTLRAMQPSTRHLAKAAIPHVLDWSDEDRIWQQVAS
jgi:hypothetical protein